MGIAEEAIETLESIDKMAKTQDKTPKKLAAIQTKGGNGKECPSGRSGSTGAGSCWSLPSLEAGCLLRGTRRIHFQDTSGFSFTRRSEARARNVIANALLRLAIAPVFKHAL